MRKVLSAFGIVLIALSWAACSPNFDGSRMGNDSQLIMEYTAFNTSDSQKLTAKAGDKISADVTVDRGQLSVKIQNKSGEPIYEENDIAVSKKFAVGIEESGMYTVTVTGRKTKGSVNFRVVNDASEE